MKEMGRHYLALFSQAKAPHARARDLPALDTLSQKEQRLPHINLNYLCNMTDDTGMLQHAKFTVPNRAHGYCVDDNARALIAVTRACDLNRNDRSLIDLSSIYLSFLDSAFDPETGRFRNFMSYERKWLEKIGYACGEFPWRRSSSPAILVFGKADGKWMLAKGKRHRWYRIARNELSEFDCVRHAYRRR